jgi:membrane protein DedA with SNARE-associated domain
MTEVLPWSPGALAEWMPFWKATGFFLATFVLEDAATVGAGLLLAAGAISWPAAFTACFLGIWMGDAGLYALARFAGRGWFERSSWRKFSGRVARSEEWFARRSTAVLIFSRLVPGLRLPTFLAAGFLRMPAGRFLLVTGLAAAGWTFGLLFLAQLFGAHFVGWLRSYKAGGWLLLGAGISLIVLLQLVRRIFFNFNFRRLAGFIGRWRHWEFWPMWLFYPPVALYYAWLAIKYRGALLPTAANPGILAGGIVGESKMATLRELVATSPEFTAEAELIAGSNTEARLTSLRGICARRNIPYPFIIKPDLGQRGAGIKLVRDEAQAVAYLRQTTAPLLVQRFVPGPFEAGVFYYRFPGESRGVIFAITEKIFPMVTGDGEATVAELIWRDPRARCLAAKYLVRLAGRENDVLPEGVSLKLVEAGNHAQGCIFRDGMRLHTPALAERIDAISQKLTGFYIGRYDIRYATEAGFSAGESFQIVELNGASAEASSIYDRRNSLWQAYRTLFRQWDLVFAIGAENRRRGCATTKLSRLWRQWRDYSALEATYPAAD